MEVDRGDQVWSTDITYVRLTSGFVYLMAVMDWYSRYVLGWALSTTLDADFCIEAVGKILEARRCEIFNTDKGAQFTTSRFTQALPDQGIQVSMDGRGRALEIGQIRVCVFTGTTSTGTTTSGSISLWTTEPLPRCTLEDHEVTGTINPRSLLI